MIRKIISRGWTAPERAALHVAEELDIEAEKTASLAKTDADGILLIASSDADANSIEKGDLPFLSLRMDQDTAFNAARKISTWIVEHRIETLLITGPDVENRRYEAIADVLGAAFRLTITESAMPGALAMFRGDRGELKKVFDIPRTVDEAAKSLIDRLTFPEKTRIANMNDEKLAELRDSLGRYMMNEFRLGVGNMDLIHSCRQISPDQAPVWVILKAVRKKVQSGNFLKVVK